MDCLVSAAPAQEVATETLVADTARQLPHTLRAPAMDLESLVPFLDLLPEAALVLDGRGRVLAANREAAAAFACEFEDLLGSDLLVAGRGTRSAIEPPPAAAPLAAGATRHAVLVWTKRGPRAVTAWLRALPWEDQDAQLALLRDPQDLAHAAPESAELQASTLALWQVGLFRHDHVTGVTQVSAVFRELCGFSPGEPVTPESLRTRLLEDDRARLLRSTLSASTGGTARCDIIHRVLLPDRSLRWVRTRALTIFGSGDGRQEPVSTVGSVMALSGHQEIGFAIQSNEQELAQALPASRLGVFEQQYRRDEPNAPPFWSPMLRFILGYPEHKPADSSWFLSHFSPEDAARLLAADQQARDLAGDGVLDLELRWRHPENGERWLHIQGSTCFTESGPERRPLRTVGVVVDVTDRKAAEGELRRRASILDATPDFVSMTDLQGNIVFLNQAGRAFLGLATGEALGARNMAPVHPQSSHERMLTEGLPTAIRAGYWRGEMEFLRHDGKIVPMSEVLISHRGDNGEVAYLSNVSRDLTREKELEQKFLQAQKMEAIGRLAGGVAHDFNNLLSVILGFTSLAIEDLEPGHPAREGLEEAQRAAERAAALTAQLLAFGRKQILQPRIIDLGESLHELGTMLQRLVGETIRVSIEGTQQPVRIKADPSQVQQILLNLVVNARDAMPNGGELTIAVEQVMLNEVRVAAKLDLAPGPYAVIVVSDTGHGMDAETRAQAFEPFFTTKAPGQGTGLGLATVFGIVRQSGGGITLQSEPHQGACFRIYLPSTEESLPTQTPPPHPLPSPVNGVVLVAEDDDQTRSIVTTVLTRAGLQVLAARDPEQAIVLADAHPGTIDILLTDVMMPGLNGKELASRVLERRPTLSVLFMSGHTEDTIVHQGILDPGVDFLAKPLTPVRLLRAIEDVLGRRHSRVAPELRGPEPWAAERPANK